MELLVPVLFSFLMIYFTIIKPNADKKAVNKWDEDVAEYKRIIERMTSNNVNHFFSTIRNTGLSMGIDYKDLPDELTKAVSAATQVIQNKTFGRLTSHKENEIDELINAFSSEMTTLIPAARGALNQSINEGGLGFGLITNSAADAALYQAMNYHDKIKHYKKMNYTVNQMIDKEVAVLMNGIKNVL